MPFTLAHPAAALPLKRLNLVWSAFIVGSMAPDFPYVVGSVRYRSLGHNFPGVVLFTLPISFVVLWVFHLAIKRPVTELLPVGMQRRLGGQLGAFRFGGVTRMMAIAFSVTLGIGTHLVWDSFTHAYTWPWRHLILLRSWFDLPVAGWMPGYGILQYASTLAGLLSLAVWILLWYRQTAPIPALASPLQFTSRVWLAIIMFATAVAAGLVRATVAASASPVNFYWDWFMLHFGVTAMAAAFWEILFYCLVATSRQHTSQPTEVSVM